MNKDYTFTAEIAKDEHEFYVRSRIEAILANMGTSGGGSSSSGDSDTIYKEITSEELAAMWDS